MDEFYKESFQNRKLDYEKKDGIASISLEKMNIAVKSFISDALGKQVLSNNMLTDG